jgi:chaperonin cofactor prefoldin
MNELIKEIVDYQFEKIIKKIESLEYKIDTLQKHIYSIDEKIKILQENNTSSGIIDIEPNTNIYSIT